MIALVGRPADDRDDQQRRCLIVDGHKLKYRKLLDEPLPAPEQNLAAVARRLIDCFPDDVYVHGSGAVAEYNIPVYPTLAGFLAHLRARVDDAEVS